MNIVLMDKFEQRRLAFIRLVESFGRGGQKRVGEILDIDQNYVSRMCYEAGKAGRKRIGEDMAEKLDKGFPGWFDESIVTIGSAPSTAVVHIHQHVEVLGAMGKGVVLRDQPGQIIKWEVTPEWIDKNVPHHTGRKNLAIVTGFGDSMKGMFNSGDPLLVDTGIKSVDFDGVYFFRVGEEGFIKILQRIPGEGIRAISKNQDYESWTITKDMDFEVFARVLTVWNGTSL
jgi:hypothetical protein